MGREPYVAPSHQVLAVGMNGRGKSVLCDHEFWKVRTQRIVVNVKRDPGITRKVAACYPDESYEPVVGDPTKLDWKRPTLEYIMADPFDVDEADKLYRELAKRHNLCTWLDECFGPTTSMRLPKGIGGYLQHGRSSNLKHLGATQRPVGIAMPLRTEAHHIVLFPRGMNPDDRKVMASHMGVDSDTLDGLCADVLDEGRYGEYGHLWYEKLAPGRPTIHRRSTIPLRGR